MPKVSPPEPQHVGDGVYVSFDGYHVNIAVNHHLNHAVALDPGALRGLIEFAKLCDEYKGQIGG